MCDDHAAAGGLASGAPSLSRRNFLHGTASVAAAAALLRSVPRLPLHSPARPAAADGTSAYSMAMHIHSSFSELFGSMEAQISEATLNGVDVLWWTDHDWRMDGFEYRDAVHFTSLNKEQGGPGQGGTWSWAAQEGGPLASRSGGIVSHPATPNDPDPHGSLSLAARSSSRAAASYGFYANSEPSDWNYRDNLTGQEISIDVLLDSGWAKGYLEIEIDSSWHPASAGRPAGYYKLSYQLVPSGTQTSMAHGTEGIITIPVRPGTSGWATVTITPSDDIANLWPDLDYRDFALYKLSLNAVSTGDAVSGYFGYLRFNRGNGGSSCFDLQQDMMEGLVARYPQVVQQQGLEVSWKLPHVNWFGPGIVVPDYSGVTHKNYLEYVQYQIGQAHKAGALVSYNHPFGTEPCPPLPAPKQRSLLTQMASTLLASKAYSCDILEAGYNLRAGVDLGIHVELWDIMSRNAIFLTGTGVSDDHGGNAWHGETNNWVTSAWASSTRQADLLASVAAGRAWSGSLSGYRGSLDLLADQTCPMGSVSVSSVTSRELTASATGLPSRGTLQVLQGAVDYAGNASLSSDTQVIASYPASSLTSGHVSLPVDTRSSSFVRTQVLDSAGKVVGLSNPVWLLRSNPPGGIPAPRAV